MTLVPHKLLCLVTLFTVRAIADNAFKAGYRSCEEVLCPGPLEKGVNYVRLDWSDEVLRTKKKIIPISYKQFLDIWNRVHFVAGSRERKRPYALRVGAGGRLDGKFIFVSVLFLFPHILTQLFRKLDFSDAELSSFQYNRCF
jgi:hypothetical protein